MRNRVLVVFLVAAMCLWLTPASASDQAADGCQMDEIVWKTGPYDAGDSYHNIYKYKLKNTSDWCGPVLVADRLPYNAGGTAGQMAYYKIWNVTDGVWVCGND